MLTEVTGIPAEYRRATAEEAWATRRPSGHPDWEIEGWVTSYLAIASGELATVTDVVPRLTGHPARTVSDHLRAHPEDWAHLAAEDPGGAVDPLAEEVGVAVVAGVLVDQVEHDQAQRAPPPSNRHVDAVTSRDPRRRLDATGVGDLGLPGGERLGPGGARRVVGGLEVARRPTTPAGCPRRRGTAGTRRARPRPCAAPGPSSDSVDGGIDRRRSSSSERPSHFRASVARWKSRKTRRVSPLATGERRRPIRSSVSSAHPVAQPAGQDGGRARPPTCWPSCRSRSPSGIVLDAPGPEEVAGRLPWSPGGARPAACCTAARSMTLADTVGAVCAFLNLPAGASTSTVASSTTLMRAVRGDSAHAVARPLHAGRSFIVVSVDVSDDEGLRVAQVTQTQAVLAERRSAASPGTSTVGPALGERRSCAATCRADS